MSSPTQITISQLSRLIGAPDAPALVDIQIEANFDADPRLIPGAFRWRHTEIESLAPRLAGRRVVIICQKGEKLSEGAAAMLRTEGVAAESLEGGALGWAAAGLPMIPENAAPPRDVTGRTLWVTRQRPKIDRIACPWLIRRFVDSTARFLFVASSEVSAVAEKFQATPFDIEGVFWSHRGDRCSFDVMVEEFGLQTEPLLRLATIVRAADTNRHDLAPQAAGLMAASLGLSRLHRDDLAQLEAGMTLYDAFYRWARDAVDETHDRPSTSVRS